MNYFHSYEQSNLTFDELLTYYTCIWSSFFVLEEGKRNMLPFMFETVFEEMLHLSFLWHKLEKTRAFIATNCGCMISFLIWINQFKDFFEKKSKNVIPFSWITIVFFYCNHIIYVCVFNCLLYKEKIY